MRDKLEALRASALEALESASSTEEIAALRTLYLGRKGRLTEVLRNLKDVPPEDRPALGSLSNTIKAELAERIESLLESRREKAKAEALKGEKLDVTLPGRGVPCGRIHPITQTLEEICAIFLSLGFDIAEGPDVETDYYNFEALNMPKDHPARDMQDTFYVENDIVLRTHTSPVQIRTMEKRRPP
ncbi:MAG TPA: phenylalanine--tRNA ligase subunit alpha, partial [Syntrophales bacterium]|nr:phenylalanine--tRNA ligase subunit alpha [Syntrophales bacterium]